MLPGRLCAQLCGVGRAHTRERAHTRAGKRSTKAFDDSVPRTATHISLSLFLVVVLLLPSQSSRRSFLFLRGLFSGTDSFSRNIFVAPGRLFTDYTNVILDLVGVSRCSKMSLISMLDQDDLLVMIQGGKRSTRWIFCVFIYSGWVLVMVLSFK